MEPRSEIYRHIKTGGLYVVIADAEMEANGDFAVVYRSLDDGRIWVRPSSEFYDETRFKNLTRAECASMSK